jgi:hypothetical protein
MSRRARRAVRRVPILAVLAGLLIGGGIIDRAGAARSRPAASVEPVPVAAPADALSSSWFCSGATNTNGTIPGELIIANSGPSPVSGRVTEVSSGGGRVVLPVQVAPFSSAIVPESVPNGGPWVAATVDMEGGAVAVDQAVDGGGSLGRAVSACATSASSQWFFPTGQTRVNADEEILLMNPYPTSVIVDLSFTTDQGPEAPVDFQGITVPAESLIGVDLGSHLRRRASIATTVSARNGSIVAWETYWVIAPPAGAPLVGTPAAAGPFADPALPVTGTVLTLGAPSAGLSWEWPDGIAGPGVDEEYVVYNPSNRPAEVRLSVGLQQGAAEPFEFSVGAGQVVPVVSEQQARIPAGVPHDATLTSVNGVPVVAARSVTANLPSVKGVASLIGGRVSAPRWIVPAPVSDSTHAGQLVVANPSATPIQAQVLQLNGKGAVPVPGIAPLNVAGGARVAVNVPVGQEAPLVISASAPVYVEYNLSGTGAVQGLCLTFAVPLS